MYEWIKNHKRTIIMYTVTISVMIYLYACESQVRSLDGSKRFVTRVELQAELDSYLDKVDIRFASLDRQDRLREMIVNNAMLLAQGQPFNPIGLLTGIATIYGVSQATTKTVRTVKNGREKRRQRKSATT